MLFVHPCISFHCPYSRRRILVRSLYTPASVFTVLIHIGLFYLAVCTPLHQFPLPLFTCTYFSAMFVHPCLSFHCPYSHARILVRCLYTPAPVSIFLIHMHVFYCAVCTSLTQFPLSLFTCTYFSALFVHPCLGLHFPCSHARILVRCLYTPASVSTFLIHMHVF